MTTRIRTLKFLPEVFQTSTNAQFLGATLDQIVDQPVTTQIQGYVGSKFGYGINANDNYVVEPTKVRTDYQLDPGVVFTKANTAKAADFITYPGIIDALKYNGGITQNNNRLFDSQIYSWDPFIDLDKLINFNQYYWLPEGAPAVNIQTDLIYTTTAYIVADSINTYDISSENDPIGAPNPTITLIRGGTYTFLVDQTSSFWIQGAPGLTGADPLQPNIQTRDVLGVTNNGINDGTVTFTVPYKDAQVEYNLPGNILVDVVATVPFDEINGQPISAVGNIDGVTSLDGLTVIFYGQNPNEFGNPSTISSTIYSISLSGLLDPIITLTPINSIANEQKITVNYGTQWKARNFFRNIQGTITLVPYISSLLDTLYYQDGTIATKVGVIKLIDSNITNQIDIDTEILGRTTYTSPNGVVFTNGLKVTFSGDILPRSYLDGEYFVQGVGTAISLINTENLIVPELFTAGAYSPWDILSYDIGNYDSTLYVPINQDYMTIARDSVDKNPWSRSNRWFHIDVINATASYLSDPTIATRYATKENKANRPIIEFYPNLKLFNNCSIGKQPVDFFDTRTTDAFSQVSGKPAYYPDVQVYTDYTATINESPSTSPGEFLVDQQYSIDFIGTTDFTAFGAESVGAGSFIVGQEYIISYVGSTNFTVIGASSSAVGVIFTATGEGSGTGTAYQTAFTATTAGVVTAGNFVIGKSYTIASVGSTDFIAIGASANEVGITFTATGVGSGTGTATQGSGTAIAQSYTTMTVPASDVFGTFVVGEYISDSESVLPRNSTILSIDGTTTLTVVIQWSFAATIPETTNVSVIANQISNDDYAVYDGARIVFSADTNPEVRNKIYVVRFSAIVFGSSPVITLTEVENGLVLPDEGVFAFKGYYNQGNDFYFTGLDWIEAQQKNSVNQPPLFDVVDKDNISFGDKTVYIGSSFVGDKLFSYGIGTGMNDPVLGFPIRYSSVSNVGDVSFDINFNSSTFTYLRNANPITADVNLGYVLNISRVGTSYVNSKLLGWQTAVAESRQYQILTFDYDPANPASTFICDVAAATDTVWPNVRLFVNNVLQATGTYSFVIGDDTTTITFTVPTDTLETVIEVAILSDQVSKQGYYQVPVNLSNNPFNDDITTANIGDIRGQYQSIFYNNPNTTGQVFGSNNYRDLGNLVPWGDRIIQNSASLVLPGAFLRKSDNNLIDSLQYNSQQYITFKTVLINAVTSTAYASVQTPATMLDDALDQITSSKTDSGPFFWSDMLPSKAAYVTNSYTFANALDTSIYPLSRIYDFSKASYYGVLIYLTRNSVVTQLISGQDYVISSDAPSVTVTYDLLQNDIVTIKEYSQTFGSYVPNTPTKLGMYPSWIPHVELDANYIQPTYFIVGHDGSYNRLYGTYTNGQLDDTRDQVLLEFETRIYNNLKLSNVIPIRDYDVIPGYFRNTAYSYDEVLKIYSQFFLNWAGQNRVEYKPQLYLANNQFTYNYNRSSNKLDKEPILQGYWRGIYQYMYDTSTPDTSPWEMIGLTTQPSWWATRYGPAPYTSDNLVLWGDLAEGLNWNNGDPFVTPAYVRPQLLQVIPVDSNGTLLSPFMNIVGNYSQTNFKRDWQVGDVGPTEFSYRRSSSWPFDLMKILSLTQPANFFNLNVDIDNYKYNAEFNQFLVNDRSHLVISDIDIYGSGTAKTSYINWIVDYQKQYGIDATTLIKELLFNTDVRLIYRLAGFTDKTLMNFYVEKGTPNSKNASLLIPNESYSVLLYDNIPFTQIVFSGVIVQSTSNGWKVFGNSQTDAFFTTTRPKINGNTDTITVETLTVKVAKDYWENETIIVPYGTTFYTAQDLAQFLSSYGNYLETQGVLFDQIESGLDVNWSQMTAEFLYWVQSGWEVGSIVNLNPGANIISINKDSHVVQPLTLQKQNYILNQNLYPIQSVDLSVVRDGTLFTAKPLNQGDTVAYGQFNISNFEHGVVFDNVTLFNDIIYNLVTGLRQNRVLLRGVKTAEWNGTVDAQGFILNQDNIQEWSPITKYTKGSIVLFKNKYWFALKVVDPSATFQSEYWKETSYDEIQKGLLPNASTRSYESGLFYNTNKSNLDRDADLLSWSLIGYRPRDYLALADLTDITQVNVYKNMIKSKGTRIAATAFKNLELPQGGIDYDIYENWAIKTGEFGGVLNDNFVDIRLFQSLLTGNPAIVSLSNGEPVDGSEQETQLYSLFNYGRPITNPNVLATIPTDANKSLLPDAGYVNFNDVKTYSYYFDGLNTAETPISKLYVGEYVWIANYQGTWNVFAPTSVGAVIQVINNLNDTVTVQFATPHNLSKYEPLAIVNFSTEVDGYRIVRSIVDPYRITLGLTLPSSTITLTGLGVGLRFDSQRIATPAEINSLDLNDTEFAVSRVWVDENNDGSWAVLQKSLNYAYSETFTKDSPHAFGNAVAYNDALGYLIADSSLGDVYRYTLNALNNSYEQSQLISKDDSFGTTITYIDDIYVISEPTSSTPKVYVYQLVITNLVNELQLVQTIAASDISSEITNWGKAIALSQDKLWLYVSAYEQNLVYAFNKSQVTGEYEYSKTITTNNLVAGDDYGYSISTNYYGDYVLIGAPGKASSTNVTGYGAAYAVNRLVQNYITPYSSTPYSPIRINLVFEPKTTTFTVTKASDSVTPSDIFVCSSTAGLEEGAIGTPLVFSKDIITAGAFTIGQTYVISSLGSTNFTLIGATSNTVGLSFVASGAGTGTGTASTVLFGGISPDEVYFVKEKISATEITLSLTRDGTVITPPYGTGAMSMIAQTEPLFVSVNGTLISDNSYGVIGTTLSVYETTSVGSNIQISGSQFVQVQEFASNVPPTVSQFGYAISCNIYGTEWLLSAPSEISNENQGAVYRYTDGGAKYGMLTGTTTCDLVDNTTILINGFSVPLISGNAETVAASINSALVPNVSASASSGILTIYVNNSMVAFANNMLSISVLQQSTLTQLGINVFTNTQTIACPHLEGRTQFGYAIKFNEFDSFVVSAPAGSRFSETTFDTTDDAVYTNDTLFDNNATQFIDIDVNAGAAYIFEYLNVYNESVLNPGLFVFAQDVNSLDQVYGNQPYYGTALDFNNNNVVIGTPGMLPTTVGGQVITYNNAVGLPNWGAFRQSSPIVDVNMIQNTQLYGAVSNNTLVNLDYIDPLQGKILGVVRQNIDIVSNVDPASYSSPESTNNGRIVWGSSQVGKLWFDTSTVKFVNYHQNNETEYNSKWWGKVFPGSQVEIYSWITSDVLPTAYAGPGTPRNLTDYAAESIQSSTGAIVPVYFYWVRNTNIVFTKAGKTLTDRICEAYITQPQSTGISYMAPVAPNVFALYNCGEYIASTDAVLHIGFSTGLSNDDAHSVYSLIRANYADDFLPGLPGVGGALVPESLYNRMLESMAGVDNSGNTVPDPFLPKAVQSGILVRPRQSFFYNRFNALKNYLQYANEILLQVPIIETTEVTFIFTKGKVNPSTDPATNSDPTSPSYSPTYSGPEQLFFNTEDYWEYVTWWAPGYSDATKSAMLVQSYYDLSYVSATEGLIVTVNKNGAGVQETYIYTQGDWLRIGLQYGTIQFKSSLWDYNTASIGFGNNFFDAVPFDTYPSEETRYIVRAINEQLPSDLLLSRNKALILMFQYIISETIESQNYIPWLNKTSFIDVTHTIRELLPLEVFQSDNQEFLEGYLNEVKPYHVVIKDFLFEYVGTDVYASNVTDFDVPATFNTSYLQYISPQLVYSTANNINQYLPENPIWQTPQYAEWFNNYGLTLVGTDDFYISNLESYVPLNANIIVVTAVYGFPINGVITIGSEQIGYSTVDLATNTISGLTRGVNGTVVQTHIPGEKIFINLSPVVVLDGGRGYTEPPRITAYIDTTIYPAPRRPAILKPIMNLDSLLRIDVIDPGEGYVVTPEIIIEPSVITTFSVSGVDLVQSTISLANQLLQTGDLVQYTIGENSTAIGGLDTNQYYYINVLQTSPLYIVAFYTTYADCIQDTHRVEFFNVGSGDNQIISVNARALAISSSNVVRENQVTLRFDRTTYNSQLVDWRPAGYYGSFFAGLYNNSTDIASSAIRLYSDGNDNQTPISEVLASSQGIAFEIQDVINDRLINWASRNRIVLSTTNANDSIELGPDTDGLLETDFLGPTTGFYITMPIKFVGAAFGTLTVDTTYYVAYIFDLTSIAISSEDAVTTSSEFTTGQKYIIISLGDTDWNAIGFVGTPEVGGIFTKNSTAGSGTGTAYSIETQTLNTATSAGLSAFPGEVSDTAIVTINYPGILTVTNTSASTNVVTVPLTNTGLGGTTGFYRGLPVFFTGSTFGNIMENDIYYVLSVLDSQTFTMAKTNDPIVLTVYSASDITDTLQLELTDELNVNDAFVLSDIVINGTGESSFAGLDAGTIYYVQAITSATTITVCEYVNGPAIELNPAVAAGPTTQATLVSQSNALELDTASGSVTMNVGLPISPGQINGQYFTMYETSGEISDGANGIEGTVSGLYTRTIVAAEDTRLYINLTSGGITNIYDNFPFTLSSSYAGLSPAPVTYYVTDSNFTAQSVTATDGSTNEFTVDVNLDGFYVGMRVEFTGVVFGGVDSGSVYFIKTVNTGTNKFTVSATLGGATLAIATSTGDMIVTSVYPYITVSATLGGSDISLTSTTSEVTLNQKITGTPSFFVGYILGGYTVEVDNAGSGFAYNNIITIDGADLGGVSGTNDLYITVDTLGTEGEIEKTILSGTPAGTAVGYYLKVISTNQLAVYSNSLLTVPVSGIDFPFVGVASTTVTELDSYIVVDDSSIFEVNDIVVFTGNVEGNIVLAQQYYVKTKLSGNRIRISETVQGPTFNAGSVVTTSFTVAKYGDFAFLAEPFYFQQSIVKYQNKVWQCVVSNNDNEFILGKWELLSSDDRKLNELDRIVGYYQPTVNMPGLDISQLITGTTYPNGTYIDNAFAPVDEYSYDTFLQDQTFIPNNVNAVGVSWNGSRYIGVINSSSDTSIISSPDDVLWDLIPLSNNPVNATSIVYAGGIYVITANNNATPIYVSTNGTIYSTGTNVRIPGFDVYVEARTLNSSASLNGSWVAVGDNIVVSSDAYNWYETYAAVTDEVLNDVAAISVTSFTGFIAVGYANSVNYVGSFVLLSVDRGTTWSRVTPNSFTVNTLQAITSSDTTIAIFGNDGSVFTSINGSNWVTRSSGVATNLYNAAFGNGVFIAVGSAGTIIRSDDNGATWTDVSYSTTSNLNSVTYDNVNGDWVIVGNDNITLTSNDGGNTWELISIYAQEPTVYTVQGDEFISGYGPEELVPGVVTDNLIMTVNTRPGSNWNPNQYGHSGFNVTSYEIIPNLNQVDFQLTTAYVAPAEMSVFIVDSATGLGVRTFDFTLDCVNKILTLTSPLSTGEFLRVDCYEPGNGDQLDRSSSDFNTFIDNADNGFTEIELNCYYTASVNTGSGVIRPSVDPTQFVALNTESSTDNITCDFTNYFTLNCPIVFSGSVFGNIVAGTRYYVKTISLTAISISETLINGIAGPTFGLSNGTGSMDITLQVGTGLPWSAPIVTHNREVLVLGEELQISSSASSTDAFVTLTTTGLDVGEPIVFGSNAIGGVTPFTTYYIKEVLTTQTFTISASLGGAVFALTDDAGSATAITNDYAISQVVDNSYAKLVFAEVYSVSTDYVSFAVFGETDYPQLGYTLPVVQILAGDNVTDTFDLTNYVGGDNPNNAVVEIDGIRIPTADYTIDSITNTITFGTAPATNAVISVTTYNLTDNQYLNTQEGITGLQFSQIVNISNNIIPPIATTTVTKVNSGSNILESNNTLNFLSGATVQFYGAADLANVDATDGTVYYIRGVDAGNFTVGFTYTIATIGTTDFTSIGAASNTIGLSFVATGVGTGTGTAIGSTEFTISTTPNGAAYTISATATGSIVASIGGQPAVRVTTSVANGLQTGDIIRIAGTLGSVQLNNNIYYVHVIGDDASSTQFDLYLTEYDPSAFASNLPVTDVTAYSGGGYAWIDQSLIVYSHLATDTTSGDNTITVSNTSELIAGTPVYFNGVDYVFDEVTSSNIVIGQKYFIKTIVSGTTFTISETFEGDDFVLTTQSSLNITVSQWEQLNTDRLWVTVNGERVASSALSLTANNDLGILSPVGPTDIISITSMVPTATPGQLRYIQTVNKSSSASVYRANPYLTTRLVESLEYTGTTIYVDDVSRLITVKVQTNTAPAAVGGVITIGLAANKNEISQVNIVNNNTGQTLPSGAYVVTIVGTVPVVNINSGVTAGDSLTITIILGNLVYIDGEMIRFAQVDLTANTLSSLVRGVNGTSVRTFIPSETLINGISSANRLAPEYYNKTWNSKNYNTILGDPLQISTTPAANFLNTGSS